MAKFVNSSGDEINADVVLWSGSHFGYGHDLTLNDDISNYDYLEIFYRSHNWINPKSTRMSLKAGARVHLSDVRADENTITIYEMTLVFSGKNVTLSGCTKVAGGAYITAVEGTIYQVIGY